MHLAGDLAQVGQGRAFAFPILDLAAEAQRVLQVAPGVEELALVGADLAESRRVLLEARGRRDWPGRDDKIVVSWNGLMIEAMARIGTTTDCIPVARPEIMTVAGPVSPDSAMTRTGLPPV